MNKDIACPLCGGPTSAATLPLRVERAGRELLRIDVQTRTCSRCTQVSIEDHLIAAVVATLEERTLPGDDIILPGGGTVH